MAYKLKPCPGCGEEHHIPKGDICWNCKRKISDYDRLKKAFIEKTGKTETFAFKNRLPLLYNRGIDYDGDIAETLQKKLEFLIHCLSPIQPAENHGIAIRTKTTFYDRPYTDKCFQAHPDFQTAYHDFILAMKAAIDSAFDSGTENGKNLLKMLHEGRISTCDFNRNR